MSVSTYLTTPGVAARTIFVDKGTIVKPPLPKLNGVDLKITGVNTVQIPTGNVESSWVGYDLVIFGGSAFDGTYKIDSVRGGTDIRVSGYPFDVSDDAATEALLVDLCLDIQEKYTAHIADTSVHANADIVNTLLSVSITNLATCVNFLNNIKVQLAAHAVYLNISTYLPVHSYLDPEPTIYARDPSVTELSMAVLLANEIRARFESHRQNRDIHITDDFENRLTEAPVRAVLKTTSGLSWRIEDPRLGQLADAPEDVEVTLSGSPVNIEMVNGALGAIVLQAVTPGSYSVKYRYLINPAMQMSRMNSFEFVFNQEKNRGYSGYPGQDTYRQRSFLFNPRKKSLDITSPYQPKRVGHKWKGLRRLGSAVLNDPTSLLLNSPVNRITYPVKNMIAQESFISYNGNVLPTSAVDPWKFYGSGLTTLNTTLGTLDIADTGQGYYINPGPPFYGHPIDLSFPSTVSVAFRCWAESGSQFILSGAFTGVGFGITNGERAVVAGFLEGEAVNLSTAISLANSLKNHFNAHLVETGVHLPNDSSDSVVLNDATDLNSLISLITTIRAAFNSHVVKGPASMLLGADQVHMMQDLPSQIAPTLVTSVNYIAILNQMRSTFNSHLISMDVHFIDDLVNTCNLVKQVGLLKQSDYVDSLASWESFAYDWTLETTYRIQISSAGEARLFLSGDLEPRVTLVAANLAKASYVNLQLNPLNQVFFGSIGFSSSNLSHWKLIRAQIIPENRLQIGADKKVDYPANALPSSTTPPWIDVGQGGSEYISGGTLVVDSSAVLSGPDAEAAGVLTGEYRGYIRPEFTLTDRNVFTAKFELSCPVSSFGIDNQAVCVKICDGSFATTFCLLEANPSPASVSGSTLTPAIDLVPGDTLSLIVNGTTFNYTFTAPFNSAIEPNALTLTTNISNAINTAFGSTIASNYQIGALYGIKVTAPTAGSFVGSNTNIQVLDSPAARKLGLATGLYSGADSTSAPRFSWTGVNLPDLEPNFWRPTGNQPAFMLNRLLNIVDQDNADFRKYSYEDPSVAPLIFNANTNWRVEFRLKVNSFAGGTTDASSNTFSGVLVQIDEGAATSGASNKNIELHFVEYSGSKHIAVYTLDKTAETLSYVNRAAYNWSDYSTYSVIRQGTDFLIYANDTLLLTIPVTSCFEGSTPGLSFGSGDFDLTGNDRTAAISDTIWSSVSAVGQLQGTSTKYIAIYRGGEPTHLSSYYLTQHNWSVNTTYLLIRDPVSGIAVKTNSNPIPVISTSYDALTIPLSSEDYLGSLVPSGKYVAFGSFSSNEISRSRWGFLNYSIGKLSSQSDFVPYKQVLNRAEVDVSSEHLNTTIAHSHFGFKQYSGGSPTDDFVASSDLPAALMLGEDTPTFQQSESKPAVPFTKSVSVINDVIDLATSHGNVAGFDNDMDHVIISADATDLATAITLLEELITKFKDHMGSVRYHKNVDRSSVESLNGLSEE